MHDLASLHPEAHTFYSRCEGIVGSVRWHPTDPNLFSCTTDEGWMQLFDVRAKNSVRHWFLSRYLFTHEWLDDHRIVGGYGDGHIQLIDTQQLNAARYTVPLHRFTPLPHATCSPPTVSHA